MTLLRRTRAGRAAPLLSPVFARLPVESAIFDGELVCLGPDGKPRFWQMMRTTECAYFAFDLLWLNGRDLRPEPWIKRQKLLAR